MKRHSSAFSQRFAFLLTGTGTALLGATLPATLHQFGLSDRMGGTLLLAGWGGSTGGAFLARGRLDRAAAVGCALSSVAIFLLSIGPAYGLWLLYLAYGIGLGVTMTAITILSSRSCSEKQRGAELNHLNLLWAMGACLTPALTLRSLQLLSVALVYRLASLIFLASAAALFFRKPDLSPVATSEAETGKLVLSVAPLRFGLFAAACVGLESAIGSWLTTFAGRSSMGAEAAVSANSAFWLGLLVSRALHSTCRLSWLQSKRTRLIHLAAVSVAIVTFLLGRTGLSLSVAGMLCGFGLGPLYPYVLSLALPHYRSTAVFVLAGCGASLLPYLTGLLSTMVGSLREAMLAPAAALVVLLITFERIESVQVRRRVA